MALPNSTIACAFIESYITIRKTTWKLDVNNRDNIKIPEDATVKHKIAICKFLLESFKEAKTFKNWIDILDEIYKRERAEFETQNNRYLLVRLFTYDPIAGEMLHAIRTYIVSELKNDPQFKKSINELAAKKEKLEKEILYLIDKKAIQAEITKIQAELNTINTTLETRNDKDEFFTKFFADTIMSYDTEAKRLDEKSFDDFKNNVQKGDRTLVICHRLIADSAKKNTETLTQTASTTESKGTPIVRGKNEELPAITTPTIGKPSLSSPSIATPANFKELQSKSALSENSTFQPPLPPRRQPARIAKNLNPEAETVTEFAEYVTTSHNKRRG